MAPRDVGGVAHLIDLERRDGVAGWPDQADGNAVCRPKAQGVVG